MKIAISPCPNDTYLFFGWIHGLVGPPPSVTYGDIQQLNEWALTDEFDLIKISCALLPRVKYELLPIGAAISHGPLLIASQPYTLEDLPRLRVAVPGRDTTAHLLLQKLAPEPRAKHFCRFDEAFDLLEQGTVEAALIIHELRFTYAAAGFHLVCDLGALWGKPVPLGCLVARDQSLIPYLRASLLLARRGHPGLMPYVQQHSQEIAPAVVQKHIDTYVTEETAQLSKEGYDAIAELTAAHLCPPA